MMADCFSSFSLMRSGKSALAWQVAHLDPPCAADDDVALDDASDAVPLRRHGGWNPGPCDRDLGVARIVGHREDEALRGSEKFPGRISATDFSLHAERLIVSTELGVRLRCAVYDDLTIRSGCSRGQKWAGEHYHAQLVVGDELRLPGWRRRQVVGVIENRRDYILVRKDDEVRIEAVDRTGGVKITTSAGSHSQ